MARDDQAAGSAGTSTALGLLAVTALTLAWMASGIAIETAPIAPDRASAPPAVTAASSAPVVAAQRPLSEYRHAVERPLFEPSRRPRAQATAEVAPDDGAGGVPSADGFRIVGIMTGKGGASAARALLRSPDIAQAVWVEVGSTIAGWEVSQVGDRTVTLENDGRRHELHLFSEAPGSTRDK